MIGKTLSHYKVLEKIGQGGMGEVYRAEDTNLSREVAIKVLPEQFTKDPQRLARFEREAKLLAQLNHPNIAAIYGFEEADDVRFLAMELVPGETLQERVAKGPLPVEEVLEVCRQIAEGVEAAHEKGVIHRDLKPANVKVTPEGKVEILDFGLAKAFEDEIPAADISQSPTLTEEMTRAGVILGTAAYMSPEQAKGKPVDKRADIFGFGAILYELLTGKRVFQGETITETLGAIIHKEPEWEALPQNTPARVRELMVDCLEKDSRDRLPDIGSARLQIKKALIEPANSGDMRVNGAIGVPPWKQALPWSLLLLTVMIAAFMTWNLWPDPPPLRRFSIDIVAGYAMSASRQMALSPDGSQLAYIGAQEGIRAIYLRSMDQANTELLPGTEGADEIFFSHDSRWIGYFADGQVKKVPVTGGPSHAIGDFSNTLGGSWGSDGEIVVGSEGVLFTVPENGGVPQPVTARAIDASERNHRNPQFLPDGKSILFGMGSTTSQEARIDVLSLETGEQKTILEGGRHHLYSPTGHLLFMRSDTLMAVSFDLNRLEPDGEPVPVLESVSGVPGGSAHLALSQDGTLVYMSRTGKPKSSLVWLNREGALQYEETSQGVLTAPSLSPDGEFLAVSIAESDGADLWIYEIGRRIFSPLTFDHESRWPVWTPDGKGIAFHTHRTLQDLYWMPVDGSSEGELLITGTEGQVPGSWSSEGVLAYAEGPGTARDIWVIQPDQEREPQGFLVTQFNERHAVFSPDGKWMALTSNQSGRDEVYVKPYATVGSMVQISTNGGAEPRWTMGGRELIYREANQWMAVPIQTEPVLRASPPTLLFEHPYSHNTALHNYDVSEDGQQFVLVTGGQPEDLSFHVVLNWFEELKRLVPTP